MLQKTPTRYRVIQLEWTRERDSRNVDVDDFDDLVTHHPKKNRNATLTNGIVSEGEKKRRHALVAEEIQEIEVSTSKNGHLLKPHQILLKKDFMLEDSRILSGGMGVRDVDVPSPVDGYVGRISRSEGLVDMLDRPNGDVIARIRHMGPILVREGEAVEYGQALGVQNKLGLEPTAGKHVHLEMDTRYYQQYENYIADLVNGRLTIDPERQTHGITALPIFDDGTFRIGETNSRIQELQEVLISRGYLGASDKPLVMDGVYRLEMQPAVLAFQRDHGLAQTGDIDRSTLHIALPLSREQVIDRMDHMKRSRAPFAPVPHLDAPVRGYQPGPEDYRHTQTQADVPVSGPMAPLHERTDTPEADPVQARMAELQREIDALRRQMQHDSPFPHNGPAPRNEADLHTDARSAAMSTPGRSRPEHESKPQQPYPQRETRAFPAGHRDYALFEAIRRQLPYEYSDDMAAHATLEAKRGGITRPDQIKGMAIENGQLTVMGKSGMDFAFVELTASAPPLPETLQQSAAFDRQQAIQLAKFQEQQQQMNMGRGPSMTL